MSDYSFFIIARGSEGQLVAAYDGDGFIVCSSDDFPAAMLQLTMMGVRVERFELMTRNTLSNRIEWDDGGLVTKCMMRHGETDEVLFEGIVLHDHLNLDGVTPHYG